MSVTVRGAHRTAGITVLVGALLVACSEDAPVGTPASLSVSNAGAGGGGAAGAGGEPQAAGQGGANVAGGSSGGEAGSGPVTMGGAAGSSAQAGAGGNGQAGTNAGGSGAGEDLPPGGPLYHVSCLPSFIGGDPAKAIRFAGKILALTGGQRFAYLRTLPVGATTLAEAFGSVQLGKTAGPAVDGDPLSFGPVTIPGKANPVSGTELVIAQTQLRLVLAGPENRPCGELDGKVIKPVEIDLAGDGSVDTCLFDPVASDTTPTPAVTNAARFVPCAP